MMKVQDIRYKADGARTATTETILLPLSLWIERPNHHAAIRDARDVIHQLQSELPRFAKIGGNLKLGDIGNPAAPKPSELVLEQAGKEEVRLELGFFVVLALEQDQFWPRAELIAQAIDFVQSFCARSRDKHTVLQMQTAQLLDTNQPKPALTGGQGA
jgi:hypothetical protein